LQYIHGHVTPHPEAAARRLIHVRVAGKAALPERLVEDQVVQIVSIRLAERALQIHVQRIAHDARAAIPLTRDHGEVAAHCAFGRAIGVLFEIGSPMRMALMS